LHQNEGNDPSQKSRFQGILAVYFLVNSVRTAAATQLSLATRGSHLTDRCLNAETDGSGPTADGRLPTADS
jgi:hypothetical protein